MDLVIVLIIVLVIVLVWRGPKTLPSLGRAFGQGVREARKEMDSIKGDDEHKDDAAS
jgi:TatA/E family protein of Tat protein translocase